MCTCGGQLRGSSSLLSPSLAPARSLQGSLCSWGKTSRPPSPLNPALGCLPWPGCLTALLMLHTGTQGPWVREGEGARAGGGGEREQSGEVRRMKGKKQGRWRNKGTHSYTSASVVAYSDLNRHHLNPSEERSRGERVVQRATECTLSTHQEEILLASKKSAQEIQTLIFISFQSISLCV